MSYGLKPYFSPIQTRIKFKPSRRWSANHRSLRFKSRPSWQHRNPDLKENIMKKSTASLLALIAALNAGHALAADDAAGKTREQVRAELAEAVRTGDMPAISMTGQKLNELYPNQYPAKPLVTGKTREQVQGELAEAIRTGDMPAISLTGPKLNEAFPSRYPQKIAVAGKTREQVQAELAEAIRTGDMPAVSLTGQKLNELNPARYEAQKNTTSGKAGKANAS
jgi:hypothetical protein